MAHKCATFRPDDVTDDYVCVECGGHLMDDEEDFEDDDLTCPVCHGTGYLEENLGDCDYCDGEGYLWWGG